MVQSVSGGDEGFIKKMVALFIETVPQNMQDLKNALQAENWEQVGKTAHKLKSTIDSMGIKSIRQEIRTVEANAKQMESLAGDPRTGRQDRQRDQRMYRPVTGRSVELILEAPAAIELIPNK